MLNLKLDKSAGASPAYTQIVHYIETSIKTNKLRPGDKLPPERDLAEQLGTARGTVKKAYEELDVITSSRGYHADGTQFVDTNIAGTLGTGLAWEDSAGRVRCSVSSSRPTWPAQPSAMPSPCGWNSTPPSGCSRPLRGIPCA